ncbi:Linoleate 10R-lipoxygenase [Cyphellophora attinorum]|uniref:Linoleate 10R-lipoxygenase n=1 Tax=Cyphellophora attinorum TaxID=1664694 RepID=A0A0N0NLQ0_9EURO|nr:Linoleate 10R-lipoxygenase [Phialophora attinorum]KPI39561.1 Linoleate 10R-lipoxygenase [Phialophora attinorum]
MDMQLHRDKWQIHVKHFYEYITTRLLHEKTVRIAGINQVDITRDIGNLAHVHFAANMFSLPLKTAETPKGVFTEHELWMAAAVIFASVFHDFEPTKSHPLRKVARKLAQALGGLIEMNVKTVIGTSFASKLIDSYRESDNPLAAYGIHMIRALTETGMSAHELAFSQILPTAAAMIPIQGQVFTQLLDFYLGPGDQHLPDIQKWAALDTAEADDKLLHYVQEGIRLNSTFGMYRHANVEHTFEEYGRQIHVKPGDNVFCSFVDAARDASVFPNPDVVDLDRPMDSYLHYGMGPHTCLGKGMSQIALTAMLRVVGKLPGLRRAPGPQGELKKLPRPGGFYVYMREAQDSVFPFPTTMKVHFDGSVPEMPTTAKE